MFSSLTESLFLFFGLMPFWIDSPPVMKKVSLKDYEDARCLDGSPGAYYISEGWGDGADKFFVFHQGGGWCFGAEDCILRSTPSRQFPGLGMGSTLKDPDVIYPNDKHFAHYFTKHFSRDQAVNPLTFNWNFVHLRYCDGFSFAGQRGEVKIGDKMIYLNGRQILNGVIDSLLQEKGLARASELIVGGCSAGGLAAYLHCDHWAKSLAPYGVKTSCLPDSGFFELYKPGVDPHVEKLFTNFRDGVAFHDASHVFSDGCREAFPEDSWRCILARNTAEFIATPIFALQSKYDCWQLGTAVCHGNPQCIVKGQFVEGFQRNITSDVFHTIASRNQNGAFVDACYHHCGDPIWDAKAWNTIKVQGSTANNAHKTWYDAVIRGKRRTSRSINRHFFWNQVSESWPPTGQCAEILPVHPNTGNFGQCSHAAS